MTEKPDGKWIPIVGYEGLYEVSDSGQVWSVKRQALQYIRRYKNKYFMVQLCKQNIPRTYSVHRLMMRSFYPDGENDMVNHIDADKSNNHLSNLEWVSRSENVAHAKANRLFRSGQDNPGSLFTDKQVIEMFTLKRSSKITNRAIAKMFGNVHESTIGKIMNGNHWTRLYDEFHQK